MAAPPSLSYLCLRINFPIVVTFFSQNQLNIFQSSSIPLPVLVSMNDYGIARATRQGIPGPGPSMPQWLVRVQEPDRSTG